jgi:hypothetical protein
MAGDDEEEGCPWKTSPEKRMEVSETTKQARICKKEDVPV